MTLTLIISDNCKACDRAKELLHKINLYKPKVIVEIIHINSYSAKSIFITPALLINNKLFSYGDIDEKKLQLSIS